MSENFNWVLGSVGDADLYKINGICMGLHISARFPYRLGNFGSKHASTQSICQPLIAIYSITKRCFLRTKLKEIFGLKLHKAAIQVFDNKILWSRHFNLRGKGQCLHPPKLFRNNYKWKKNIPSSPYCEGLFGRVEA